MYNVKEGAIIVLAVAVYDEVITDEQAVAIYKAVDKIAASDFENDYRKMHAITNIMQDIQRKVTR